MKRAWRWTKRIVLGAIVLVLLVIGGALIFIHTDYGRDFVRRKAEGALLDSFPGGAHIGRIEGSVFGTLVIDDLRLDSRDGKPMIVVGTARVKISLLALIRKTVRLDRLDLEDVTFDKHPQPEMSPEIPKQDNGGTWAIEIPRASVLRGRVVVATTTRTVLDVSDLEAQASISVDHGITIAAHALGSSAGKSVEATALFSYINETLAFPLAVAKLDQANVFAVALYLGPRVDGVIRANVPAATAKALAGVKLPGDAELVVTALDGNVDAKATMAGSTVHAFMDTDLVAKSAKGLVIVDVPEATRLDPRIAGGGIVTASINASPEHVRGMVTVDGIYRVDQATVGKDRIHGTSVIAIDAALTGAWLFFESGTDLGTARATAIAEVTRDKGIYTLTKSTVIAAARRVGARKTDLAVGSITASVRASGRLYPKPQIKVTGSVGGDSLRYGDLSAQTVDLSLNAANVTKLASGHLDLGTVRKGDTLLGSASLDAHGSLERTEAGNIFTIDLDSHTITTATQGTWTGSGGHVVIDPAKITLANLHTGTAGSKVIADVAFTKATKDLTAKVDAQQVALESITPKAKGMVGAHLDVARRGGRWSGKGHFTAAKLTIPQPPVILKPGEVAPPSNPIAIDVDATLEIKGRRVIVDATTTAEAGAVTLDADVNGPYDLTDVHAWKRLDRRAINVVGVGVSHVDVSKLRPNLTGIVDGKLGLTATDASGDVHISDVSSDVGTIQGDLTMKPDDKSQIALGMSAKLDANEVISGDAKIALPLHPFDPDAWKQLGKRVLKSADIVIKPVDIDPNLLAKLHINAPYRARAQGVITLDEGADKITVIADVADLSGGHIKQPIAVHSETTLDDKGVHETTDVKTRNQTLIKIEASSPLTLDTLTGIRQAKLDGLITIPDANAADIVAVIGRGDVVGGKVAGIFKIGGVIGKPTGDGKLTLTNIAVAPSISGRKSAVLQELSTKASFDGEIATLDIKGIESKTATLDVNVRVKPTAWRDLTASVQAVNFDIAPATAFAPGALSAAKGTITASLKLQGVDPETGVVEGKLQIHGGRYPLSPLLGTLRSIEAELTIANQRVTIAAIDGKLGKGTIHANGYVTLAGSEPKKLHVDGVLTDISLVRAFQPTIGANVAIDLTNSGAQFTGDIVVSRAHVEIVTSGGVKLLDATPPSDILFVEDGQLGDVKLGARQPPTKPWLLANVDIRSTAIEILQEQFQIRGAASGKVELSLGQGSVGLDGTIEATRGDIDLLGTRSQLERGEVIFDGTVDPLLNVRVVRELDALTITAQVSGRASKPEVTMSSDTGSYTQGELYSFFLGGQSSGSDATQAGYAAGAGFASALVSQRFNDQIGKRLHLPVRVDLNYEVGTATSTEALRVGTWFTAKLFFAARAHPEARVDENASEILGEYHLRNNIVIEAQWGIDGANDSADLVRRWNW
jgi:autotransporter translocation and assembly factor TamB